MSLCEIFPDTVFGSQWNTVEKPTKAIFKTRCLVLPLVPWLYKQEIAVVRREKSGKNCHSGCENSVTAQWLQQQV